jgi:hypothetical protein
MTKSPVNNGNKKGKGGQHESKFPSPKKNEDIKKKHEIINLVHLDAAKTPYGWAFKNFYDAREHLKALSNKTGDTTAIKGKEFKPFNNLTTRWIKLPNWDNFYGSYVLTMMVNGNSHWKLTKSMLIKLHVD